MGKGNKIKLAIIIIIIIIYIFTYKLKTLYMKKALFILFATLVFVACKKEDRIEKNLWKQGGEWNIETWDESQTSSYFPEDNSSEVVHDFGTMKFNKDGSGSMTIKYGTSAYTEPFTYENTENTLTIFDEDGEGVVHDLDWKRNEFTTTLNTSGDYTTSDEYGNPITVYTTHSLKIHCKKK